MSKDDLVTRFWAKVNKDGPINQYRPELGPCWIWTAAVGTKGYGVWLKSSAHRFSYRVCIGAIPRGLQLDHLCRVHLCVNPSHLEAVTPRENLMRGETRAADNVRKTHCPKGHPYDESNTYIDATRPTERLCRICRNERTMRWKIRTGYKFKRNHAEELAEAAEA